LFDVMACTISHRLSRSLYPAQDRVHRIGQTRNVRVLRFVMKDSIESRMVKIQESKSAQAKGAFGKLSDKEKRVSRLQDLRKLLELPNEVADF